MQPLEPSSVAGKVILTALWQNLKRLCLIMRRVSMNTGTDSPSIWWEWADLALKEEIVQKAYNFALTEIDKNIKENPIDNLPYLYGSRLNIILGKDDPKSPL